jgi:hypothetical protein
MKIRYILLFSLLLLISCQSYKLQSQEKLVNPIDTLQIIKALNITEHQIAKELMSEMLDSLSTKLDTMELVYHFAFCDCQRWIERNIYEKVNEKEKNVDKLDARGQIEFNLERHGYYIEPAQESLELPDCIHVNGTKIRLIGRLYKNLRLPESGQFTVPNPPLGKVFRYYGYEILRPYKVWGNHVEVYNFENKQIYSVPSILTVK